VWCARTRGVGVMKMTLVSEVMEIDAACKSQRDGILYLASLSVSLPRDGISQKPFAGHGYLQKLMTCKMTASGRSIIFADVGMIRTWLCLEQTHSAGSSLSFVPSLACSAKLPDR
jgi:hypothetical protein